MQKCTTNKNIGTKNKKIFLRTILLIFKATPWLLIIVMISELLIGLLQTGTLIAWKYVINSAEIFLNNRNTYLTLIFALLISLGSYVMMDLFRMILESFYTKLYNQLSQYFQSKLYDKCKTLNAIHFEDTGLYNEIDRANNSINGMLSLVGIIGIFVMGFSRIITLGTYVMFSKPILALIVVLPIVPILITRFIRGKDLYWFNFEQSEKRRECNYYRKCISSKETKTLLAMPYFTKKWSKLYSEINNEEKKINKKHSLIFAILNLLKYLIYIIAIVLVAKYLFDGSIDIGMFALIAGMLGTTHATIEVVFSRSGDIAGSLRYAKDYFSFLDKSDDVLNDKVKFNSSIRLKDVWYSYPNSDKHVLQNINLSIKSGEKIALVGVNGAGKTTLAKLILGLYNPTQGEIFFDEKSRLRNLLLDCSAVFQNFCRYYLTLRENVAFGEIEKIDEDEKLLQKLKEFDFDIFKANKSLDTQLGREFEGVELSGGEWQKLALARGFLKSSDFIILDEPNSNLDPMTENKMFAHFMELLKERTGLIITHRIGMASMADRIILLENGKICEEGTHQDLMERKGQYRKLFEMQANMYK